jgi:predicted phosphoribosyltransferase
VTGGAAGRQFLDRRDAGRRLAGQLRSYAARPDVVVLALPRGGVPVAFEVALALRAPLAVMPVRKLGVPGRQELAFGAIAGGGVRVLNPEVVADARLTPEQIEAVSAAQRRELDRRRTLYRGGRPEIELAGRTAILVDDGLATGATMRAAIQAVREQQAGHVVVAVPVGAAATRAAMTACADSVVCLLTPARFVAVGQWYSDFTATSDQEVTDLLALADAR